MAARQGFEPWAPHGATVFDAARFGRSLTLPTITTIALVPATRKHGGGDDAARAVNNPRKSGHLYRITTGNSPSATKSSCKSSSVKRSPSLLVHT